MTVQKVWVHLRSDAPYNSNVQRAVAFRGAHWIFDVNDNVNLYDVDMIQLENGRRMQHPDCKRLVVPHDNVSSIMEVEYEADESSD